MTKKLHYLALLCLFIYPNLYSQSESDTIFDNSFVHEIRMQFAIDNFWDTLMYNYNSVMFMEGKRKSKAPIRNKEEMLDFFDAIEKQASAGENNIPYLISDIIIDGDLVSDVGVRLKGFSSFFSSPGTKKSLKIDFNEFNDTLKYRGLKKLNLNNGVGDPSLQRDFISYYLMRKAGIAAPRVSYAKVYLNDIYWGLYAIVEQVDKTFVQNNFASGKGDLYKTISNNDLLYISDKFENYQDVIELKTNEETSDGIGYINFLKVINQLNGERFADSLQRILYTDYYLKILTIDILSKNWDSYIQHGRNFYLYHDPVSELIYWIPWDYNLAWDGAFPWFMDGGECNKEYANNSTFSNDTAFFSFSLLKENLEYFSVDYGEGNMIEGNDFSGDDEYYTFQDTIIYSKEGIYNIGVWYSYTDGCYSWKNEKAYMMDTIDLECKTILTMPQNYFPDDEKIGEVYALDSLCCNCQWDRLCSNIYMKPLDSNVDDEAYSIEYMTDKHLIRKMLNNEDYYNRYLDIFSFILDSVYNADELIELMYHNTDLIREAVYADTSYLFSQNEFENDINTSCSDKFEITSLKRLVERRKAGLEVEYESLNYNPKPLEKTINKGDIVINEFVADTPEGSEESDWIEFYNNTTEIISLNNTWISDDRLEPQKYKFAANVAIRPNGFVVVWADNKDKQNGIHTGFKLSASGEDIILTHESFDTLDVLTYGPQYYDSSFARYPNGTGPFRMMEPTQNSYNIIGGVTSAFGGENYSAKIIAYPNPANEIIWIKAQDNSEDIQVVLYDALGNKVRNERLNGGLHQINISDLSFGLYLLDVSQNGNSYRTKIIVE